MSKCWTLRISSLLACAIMVGVMGWLALRPAQAGEAWIPPQQDIPPVTISSFSPAEVTSGHAVTLTVYGTNFLDTTVVQLNGVGALPTTYIDTGTLTAALTDTLTGIPY